MPENWSMRHIYRWDRKEQFASCLLMSLKFLSIPQLHCWKIRMAIPKLVMNQKTYVLLHLTNRYYTFHVFDYAENANCYCGKIYNNWCTLCFVKWKSGQTMETVCEWISINVRVCVASRLIFVDVKTFTIIWEFGECSRKLRKSKCTENELKKNISLRTFIRL